MQYRNELFAVYTKPSQHGNGLLIHKNAFSDQQAAHAHTCDVMIAMLTRMVHVLVVQVVAIIEHSKTNGASDC